MLSSVFASGRVGEVIDPTTRYIEIDRMVPGPTGRFDTQKFPVRAALGKTSRFMQAPDGALVIFKGRIEEDPTLGMVLVEELEEIYVLPAAMKKV